MADEALRAAGATVDRVLVVVDREEGPARGSPTRASNSSPLVTASELLADR